MVHIRRISESFNDIDCIARLKTIREYVRSCDDICMIMRKLNNKFLNQMGITDVFLRFQMGIYANSDTFLFITHDILTKSASVDIEVNGRPKTESYFGCNSISHELNIMNSGDEYLSLSNHIILDAEERPVPIRCFSRSACADRRGVYRMYIRNADIIFDMAEYLEKRGFEVSLGLKEDESFVDVFDDELDHFISVIRTYADANSLYGE